MQKIKQITLTLLLLVTPVILSAQVGSKRYVTKSKDTTIVVMDQSGLKGEASAFLRDEAITKPDRSTRYEVLREAAGETSRLVENVTDLSKVINVEENPLDYDRSKRNIERNKIEREIERLEKKKLLYQDTSSDEIAFLEHKFGNKPSYFINGLPADEKIVAYIPEKEILSRSLKVSNTITGNPNGEIWYVVPNATLERFGIAVIEEEEEEVTTKESPEILYHSRGEYFKDESAKNTGITSPENLSSDQKRPLTKQEEEVEALKKQINEVRRKQGLSPLSDNEFQNPKSPAKEQQTSSPQKQAPTNQSRNSIINDLQLKIENEPVDQNLRRSTEQEKEIEELKREINALRNQRGLNSTNNTSTQPQSQTKETTSAIKTTKESKSNNQEQIVTFNDSPLEKAKKQEEVEESPKRSVRKIKERERSK